MSPRPSPALLLAALALSARSAGAAFVCPVSNKADTSCFCTSGCSLGGDVAYPWSAPVYPVPSVDLGTDTICATVLMPCVAATAYANLTQWLGISGNVQYDNNPRRVPCGPGPTAGRGGIRGAGAARGVFSAGQARPPRASSSFDAPRPLPSNDFAGCGTNTLVELATSFNQTECATFAALWLALPASTTGVPAVYTCTTSNCNTLGLAAPSAAWRSAGGAGALVAAAVVALAATFA